jgi:hypothetical protein
MRPSQAGDLACIRGAADARFDVRLLSACRASLRRTCMRLQLADASPCTPAASAAAAFLSRRL